ncbi:MAG: hypothetical protein JWQ25_2294 [Daejeonella sp.]|nr:hypothetical protein [Daejeonella sp.]
MRAKYLFIIFFACLYTPGLAQANPIQDQILGKWMSSDEKIIVSVFKDGGKFKAKVVWFDDSDRKNQPMSVRTDINNPEPILRKRKLIGLEVLSGLTYNPENNRWENGMIYDARTAKLWSSNAYITEEGLLKVKGYWCTELFSKTMLFKRVN